MSVSVAPVESEPTSLRKPNDVRSSRKGSALWWFIYTFGSIRWALILLSVIAASVGFATFMESRFDQAVASHYIYNALWFKAWLLGLCINLFCAAMTRWPWKKRHIGFVITHAGIITLLIGSEIGQILGFEAFVDLDKTKPPVTSLITKDQVLKIENSSGEFWEQPFDLQFSGINPDHPRSLPIPLSPYDLVINATSTRLTVVQTLAPSQDPQAPYGVALRILNPSMGQDVPALLFSADSQDTYDFFGMATINLVNKLPDLQPKPAARDTTPFHETQVVFALHPQGPVIDSDADVNSGYHFVLLGTPSSKASSKLKGQKSKPLSLQILAPDDRPLTTLPLQVGSAWIPLPKTKPEQKLFFKVAAYWPDFYMNGARPATASPNPNNPAALIQLMGPTSELPPPQPGQVPVVQDAKGVKPDLKLYLAPGSTSGTLSYESVRNGVVTSQGDFHIGKSIEPGWSKWQVQLDSIFPHAEARPEIKEVPVASDSADSTTVAVPPASALLPGFRAHLSTAATGEALGPDVWILAGTSRELFTKNDFIRVGFGESSIPLPFSITLRDFQVPRDEGTETPSDYISSLVFQDMRTGRVVQGTAHMNEPAMYPGEFWRSLLGWNYKFSQANWNPQDLNQTTLQVLYDPGWPLKWIGSLEICLGIATMFYFWPNKNVPRVSQS